MPSQKLGAFRVLVALLFCFYLEGSDWLHAQQPDDVTLASSRYANRPVTLRIRGPETSETATPNPFLDYRVDVTFTKDELKVKVPAYFCATQDAADSSAEKGQLWQAHFIPPRTGQWKYKVAFRMGEDIAVESEAGKPTACDKAEGTFQVELSNATDTWSEGKLQLASNGMLRYDVSGRYYLKGGADSPENFLGYVEFDNTLKNPNNPNKKRRHKHPLHKYQPHVKDLSLIHI